MLCGLPCVTTDGRRASGRRRATARPRSSCRRRTPDASRRGDRATPGDDPALRARLGDGRAPTAWRIRLRRDARPDGSDLPRMPSGALSAPRLAGACACCRARSRRRSRDLRARARRPAAPRGSSSRTTCCSGDTLMLTPLLAKLRERHPARGNRDDDAARHRAAVSRRGPTACARCAYDPRDASTSTRCSRPRAASTSPSCRATTATAGSPPRTARAGSSRSPATGRRTRAGRSTSCAPYPDVRPRRGATWSRSWSTARRRARFDRRTGRRRRRAVRRADRGRYAVLHVGASTPLKLWDRREAGARSPTALERARPTRRLERRARRGRRGSPRSIPARRYPSLRRQARPRADVAPRSPARRCSSRPTPASRISGG